MGGIATGPIGTLGNIENLTVGGRTFVDIPDLIILGTNVNGSGAPSGTFRIGNGSSGYQVPSGKTLNIYALSSPYVGATGPINIGYAENDLGFSSNTAATNPVYMYGTSSFQALGLDSTSGPILQVPILFQIPTGMYPLITNNGASASGSLLAYGYLS